MKPIYQVSLRICWVYSISTETWVCKWLQWATRLVSFSSAHVPVTLFWTVTHNCTHCLLTRCVSLWVHLSQQSFCRVPADLLARVITDNHSIYCIGVETALLKPASSLCCQLACKFMSDDAQMWPWMWSVSAAMIMYVWRAGSAEGPRWFHQHTSWTPAQSLQRKWDTITSIIKHASTSWHATCLQQEMLHASSLRHTLYITATFRVFPLHTCTHDKCNWSKVLDAVANCPFTQQTCLDISTKFGQTLELLNLYCNFDMQQATSNNIQRSVCNKQKHTGK